MNSSYGLPEKREAVIQILQDAFVAGKLDDYDYEERVSKAIAATSLEEIRSLISDFPTNIQNRIFPSGSKSVPTLDLRRSPSTRTRSESFEPIRGVMSDQVNRLGVIDKVSISSIMSKQLVDFSHAEIISEESTIRAEAIMSDLTIDLRNEFLKNTTVILKLSGVMCDIRILVPKGVQTEREMSLYLGEFSHKNKKRGLLKKINFGKKAPEVELHAPFYLILKGSVFMGSVRLID